MVEENRIDIAKLLLRSGAHGNAVDEVSNGSTRLCILDDSVLLDRIYTSMSGSEYALCTRHACKEQGNASLMNTSLYL